MNNRFGAIGSVATAANSCLYPNITIGQGATVVTTTPIDLNSTTANVAMKGAQGDALVVIVCKNGATSVTLDGKITECATSGGTYTDVPGATMTQIPATDAGVFQRIIRLPLAGRLQYIKMSFTAGSGTNGPAALFAVLVWPGVPNLPSTLI